MQDLKQREDKIKERRRQTPWREFVKEIASRRTFVFHKNDGQISQYPPVRDMLTLWPMKKYAQERDGFLSYGNEYDFSKSFLENFKPIFQKVPFPHLFVIGENENSDYTLSCTSGKNCYLSFNVAWGENVAYTYSAKGPVNNVYSSVAIWDNCDNIYMSTGLIHSFNIFYSKHIDKKQTKGKKCVYCGSVG